MSSHVAVSSVRQDSHECPTQFCAEIVVRGNFFPCGSVKCASASVQKVQMTRSMMNGHEIWVRAGPLDGASLFCVSFDCSEFNSIDASSGSAISVALSFSLMSNDEPGVWSTDAKLKMKIGIVSVTAKQDTESRLQDSQSSLDVEMTVCSVVSAHLRVHSLKSSSVKEAF